MNLDREDFRQWLVAKEPNEVVGEAENGFRCPGSNWLNSLLSGACARLTSESLVLQREVRVPSPDWLKSFVRRLDGVFSRPRNTVTAKQALEVLDSLDVA